MPLLGRVVVTGLGAVTPIGNSASEYWSSLITGKSGAGLITYFDTTNFKTKFACEVKGFNPELYFEKKDVRKYDRFAQYAIATSTEAIQDAQLALDKLNLNRCGVIWGSGIGGVDTFYKEVSEFVKGDGTPRFNPFFIPKMISDIASGVISIRFGFTGLNFTTVSACASSTNAIIDAYNYIRLKKADVIICGGSEAAVTEAGMGGFNALKALSTRNDSPETASRPFDQERDGFVLGEGSGALVLEDYDHAIARGAKIYAEVVGMGLSADAYHMTAPHPDGIGAAQVMINALEDAQIQLHQMDYINVHGTSTPLGDVAEIKAIKTVFKEHAYKLHVSSTKSMTGHLLGAAGAIEGMACVLSVYHNIIPPTINYKTPDPEIDSKVNITPNKAVEKEVRYALSNTFGFGGHNASVIFKKFEN